MPLFTARLTDCPSSPGSPPQPAMTRRMSSSTRRCATASVWRLQEPVELTPVRVHRSFLTRAADALFGQSRYVIARVQAADLATVEQGACALTPLALQLLGIEPGDLVIVEGCHVASGEIRPVRLRAFPAPGEMLELRRSVSGGTLRARFPDTRDALGVFPDLPWAFLDKQSRDALHVEKLHPVRIRAARGQQIGKDLRELTFVISLGLIGLLVSHLSAWLRVGGLVIVSVLIVSVIIVRLRTRLGRRQGSRDGLS